MESLLGELQRAYRAELRWRLWKIVTGQENVPRREAAPAAWARVDNAKKPCSFRKPGWLIASTDSDTAMAIRRLSDASSLYPESSAMFPLPVAVSNDQSSTVP